MMGPPKDKPGECNARLFLADDFGDNPCTFRCQLALDHQGLHCETFQIGAGKVVVTWEVDERGTRFDPTWNDEELEDSDFTRYDEELEDEE